MVELKKVIKDVVKKFQKTQIVETEGIKKVKRVQERMEEISREVKPK